MHISDSILLSTTPSLLHRNGRTPLRRYVRSLIGMSIAISTFALNQSSAFAAVKEIGPGANLITEANALMPGDELVLQGGTYNVAAYFAITVQGTQNAPIIIRAKDGEVPIVTRPDANQNTINIVNSAYLELRGIEVAGGSHGIRINNSNFITIERCHIHNTADVALSANVPGGKYQGLRLLRNHIHDTDGTGEGMYLGCNTNGCQMFDSLIEGNYIHHTNGPNVAQGDGIEIKEGSYNNIVRDNVIHDTKYPCIITYSTVMNGGPNIIERNVLWRCGDHAIQSAADARIRNNIILGAAADGIRNQPHQSGSPGNLEIVHNTILAPQNSAIRSDGITGSVLIANNAVYAQNGSAIRVQGTLGGLVVAGNVGMGGTQGVNMGYKDGSGIASDFVAASFSNNVPNNVFPASASSLVNAGDAAHVVTDDFNGTPRQGIADVGAYKFDAAGNPGWVLETDFKDLAMGSSSSSSSSSGSGSSSSSSGNPGTGGAGGASGSSSSSSGNVETGGSGGSGGGSNSGDEGSCACRTGASSSNAIASQAWLFALGALAIGLRGRRRNQTSAGRTERFRR